MLRTACYDWHVQHGAQMVDFAGWEMPLKYTSIVEEHQAVRQAAGLFDIAHMGRLRVSGDDAARFVDHLVTARVVDLPVGRIRYALVTNQHGGVLDDILVYRFPDYLLLVVNASNRTKILDWLNEHRQGHQVAVDDLTFDWFMLALQGPKAVEIISAMGDPGISTLKYYRATETRLAGQWALVSRTGYTGEDGFEVIVSRGFARPLWEQLIQQGADVGLQPAGLGARDTLRLEAGMPLYGHELDESIDPFTAGLDFAVDLEGREFVGKSALIEAKSKPDRLRRVGLELEGRRIARQGAAIFADDRPVGRVSSGSFSPTLNKPIAMGFVQPGYAEVGTPLEVDIRGKRASARVVALPFYHRRRRPS